MYSTCSNLEHVPYMLNTCSIDILESVLSTAVVLESVLSTAVVLESVLQ